MSRRVNIMFNDSAWRVLERLPRGERSRTVNAAILQWARTAERHAAAARMDASRATLPRVGTEEVVRWVREGRDR